MGIRLDNLTPLQKYLCSFNAEKAPKITGARLPAALKADKFTKSKPVEQVLPHNPDKLYNLCNYFHKRGGETFEAYKKLFETAFADILQNGGEIKGRVKSTDSIFKKLVRRGGVSFSNIEQAYNKTPDIRGYKLITNGAPEDMQKVVEEIEKLVDDGTLKPASVINRGKTPYLDNDQTERLIKKGFEVKNLDTPGLNNVNVLFKDKNGRKLELQITGKETETLSAKEHPFYKFRQQPMFAAATDDNGKHIDDLTLKFGMLKEEGLLDEYSGYINDCYSYARSLELGTPAEMPTLPEKVKEVFNEVENAFKLSDRVKFTSPTEFYQ